MVAGDRRREHYRLSQGRPSLPAIEPDSRQSPLSTDVVDEAVLSCARVTANPEAWRGRVIARTASAPSLADHQPRYSAVTPRSECIGGGGAVSLPARLFLRTSTLRVEGAPVASRVASVTLATLDALIPAIC